MSNNKTPWGQIGTRSDGTIHEVSNIIHLTVDASKPLPHQKVKLIGNTINLSGELIVATGGEADLVDSQENIIGKVYAKRIEDKEDGTPQYHFSVMYTTEM